MDIRYFEDYEPGEKIVSEEFSVSEEELASYLKLFPVEHPMHKDKEVCRKMLGTPDLLVPGCMTLAYADYYWSKIVAPKELLILHYGHDKIRYISPLLCNEKVHCEFKVIETKVKDQKYGTVTFETYVIKNDGKPVLYEIDKVLVPIRNRI
jgi:acyl dehydratase